MRSRTKPALFTTASRAPKRLEGGGDHRWAPSPVRHVVAVGDGLATSRADGVDHLAGGSAAAARPVELAAEVVDHDARTLASQLQRVGSAQAAPGAGDDGDTTVADI